MCEAAGPERGAGEVGEDALLGGRVRLLQPLRGHRAGTDAVLLAAAAQAEPGQVVADVGAATGAVGLMVASRMPDVSLLLVERDPVLAALCRRNLVLNGRGEGDRVAEADILASGSERRRAGLAASSVDLVLTNPPFLDPARARSSPRAGRASAHMLPVESLEKWVRACSDILRDGGHLVLIHRADHLREVLASLGRGFGGLRLRFVHPGAGRPAARLLVIARKSSRAPLSVLPPLMLHDSSGRFTPEVEALHQGEALLG